ncbi:Tektin-3 [Armadillidium vulgare]|nr:Tektin-3 [Armadillidium vulgare]
MKKTSLERYNPFIYQHFETMIGSPGLPYGTYGTASPLNKTVALKTVDVSPFEQSLSLVPPALCKSYPSETRIVDSIRLPNIFSSATAALRTRYTPADWSAICLILYAYDSIKLLFSTYLNALFICLSFLRMQLKSILDYSLFYHLVLCFLLLALLYTYDKTNISQRESSQRLGERVSDITYWRSELLQELDRMLAETNRLDDSRRSLEHALKETEKPFHVSKECLYFRENRQDKPEENLLREVDTIRDCQHRMRNLLDRVNLQLSRNRAARQELEHDTQNKNHALTIDHTAHIRLERTSSQRLRAEVEALLAATYQDMWSAFSRANSGLTLRSAELNDTRNRLLEHRNKVQQEMNDLERQIDSLKKGILDKSLPLKVVQSRLEGRTHRPETELCRDPPQHRMVREVHEISESVEALRQKLQDAEDSLHRLAQVRARLDHDIGVKTNSLYLAV